MFPSSILAIALVAVLAGCAAGPGGGGRFDPNARETLGVVVARKDTGTTTRQAGRTMVVPIGALFIPLVVDRGPGPLPIYEHEIKLDDGRTVTVFSWYPHHQVGGCVKLFESPRSDYPRLVNDGGCKPNS